MDSAAAMLAAHGSNDTIWKTTDDDDIGLLVSEEDLVCYHFNVPPIKKSEAESYDMFKPDNIMSKQVVETVEEECTSTFVFDDAEELFLTVKVHVKAPNMDCAKPLVDNIEAMFDGT